jgi:hypothetical protein
MANVSPVVPQGNELVQAVKVAYASGSALAVNSSIASCEYLDFREFNKLAILGPSALASVTVLAAVTATGTYSIVNSVGTSGVVPIAVTKWHGFDPNQVGPLGFLKFLASAATTIQVQVKT